MYNGTQGWHSAAVVRYLHNKKVVGSNLLSSLGGSVLRFPVIYVCACVVSGYSSFLRQSKDMHVSLVGVAKLAEGVSGCLFLRWPCRLVVLCHVLSDSCDMLQQLRKFMNACVAVCPLW